MKTTIEIADDLFKRARRVAREAKTTFRSLNEQGLRLVLHGKEARSLKWKWKPVTFRGKGLSENFNSCGWEEIRYEIYRGHGT